MNVYFTDWFDVSPDDLEEYGAFNISLINDLPVFVDPFLLFSSDKQEYQELHEKIINYIIFLREMSESGAISKGLARVGRVRRALRCLSRLIDIPRAVTRLSRLSWRRNAEGGLRRAARMMGLDVQRDARLIRPTLATLATLA